MSTDQFSKLFHKYVSGTASEAEVDSLMEMIRLAEYDARLKGLLEQTWVNYATEEEILSTDESAAILEKVTHPKPEPGLVRRGFFRWTGVAAASVVFLVLCSAIWFFTLRHEDKENGTQLLAKAPVRDVLPGSNTAVLMLDDGSVVMLDSATNGRFINKNGVVVSKQDSLLRYNSSYDASPVMAYNKIVTPRKGTFQLELSDGTRVWLNASSSLRFPVAFSESEREVEITGEVYMEVAQMKNKPFRVKVSGSTGPVLVDVLGTSLNIKAYGDEPEMKTTLIEGAVRVTSGKSAVLLKPGQQAVLPSTASELNVRAVDSEKVVAWKNGLFDFDNEKLEDILRQLSRWYDVEIASEVPEKAYTGAIRRSVNISEVLKMLEATSKKVEFEITDNRKIIIKQKES